MRKKTNYLQNQEYVPDAVHNLTKKHMHISVQNKQHTHTLIASDPFIYIY